MRTANSPGGFAVMARGWAVVAAPITMLLMARHFTPAVQGFYYTFGSILGLKSFAELGFFMVVTSVASHEWALLELSPEGTITGDPAALSRLVSLGRLVAKWYSVATLLYVLGAGFGGYWFLAHSPHEAVHWQLPWCALILLDGVLFWTLPFTALLEGCNQVKVVNQLRLSQGVLGNLGQWSSMTAGWNLWTWPVMVGIGVVRDIVLVLGRYRRFFATFLRSIDGPRVSWRIELWPMQWRLGISALLYYFSSQAITPMIFHYRGAVAAGRMGMSISLVLSLASIPMAWMQTKAPMMGMLIARRDYASLDALFRRATLVCGGVYSAGAVSLLSGMVVLQHYHLRVVGRLLPLSDISILALAYGIFAVGACQAAYLRAHKREPLSVLSSLDGALTGLSVWYCARNVGITGVCLAFLSVRILSGAALYLIFLHCRASWHGEP